MNTYNFTTEEALSTNTDTMSAFLTNKFHDVFTERDVVTMVDGSYAEVRTYKNDVWELRARGNGDFCSHSISFELQKSGFEGTPKLNTDIIPLYKCHKVVRALKIQDVTFIKEGAVIHPEGYFPSFQVDKEFTDKHDLTVDGYFVVYEDGYQSFSPIKAFEDGYTKVK